ncbi:Arginine/serine-rich-splicing factor RSP31 [Monoraphidium neglectum]|uniref:Arginine/serine-rich-splicing factor RSP31 n=1 Tax=Monoraphidium neglectum TaxID=145388 RepID=A0A0D2N6S6_9CHLO|nr:Arginine/serine-rich-splicing factor RSP31 [Monoraphidium neglectum]KIZ01586.1 Arginine/serine-rich-splicing factor RSP31 [Monoraphidium neglectum]|eukprot:XP_013900605.1 Arginine/serine-rich-splicing factor RSP31 [Monoraphidium neglectum]
MGDNKQPIYVGNFEYDASERDVLRLLEKYGPVDRIDMKTGFAFCYMRNKRDADEAIQDLDRREWGYRRPRPLKVQWAKKVEEAKEHQTPSKTLFVVNFDVMRTTIRDVEDHFYKYGRLRRVDIKRNYAFVEFET